MSKVKVRILKNISDPVQGNFSPDTVVEVDEEFAKKICTPVQYPDRAELFVKAILLETSEQIANDGVVQIPLSELTVADMLQMGVKNVVKTPEDKDHVAYLESAGALPTKKNAETRKTRLEQRQASAQPAE